MGEVTIVGGGFSAYLAKLLLGERVTILCGTDFINLGPNQIQRRRVFEVNKLFGKKSYSATKLKPSIKKLKLHDRLINGGNSNIWGGVIDASDLPRPIIEALNKSGVTLQPLSFKKTGSISSKSQFAQLLDSSGRILDVSKYFQGRTNHFLESFFMDGDRIGLRIVQTGDHALRKTIYTKQLIICTGVVQTIDLLYRSGFINEGDKLTLCEFGHQISITPTFHLEKFKITGNKAIVRFDIVRAICHFLGIQKKLWLSNLTRYIPIYVDQIFLKGRSKYMLQVINGNLIDLPSDLNLDSLLSPAYGSSIHYCNLEINAINANQYLQSIGAGLIGIGMAFVDQKEPGPISNDIIQDAVRKLSPDHI
ncbi:hypothetical protein [Polynucleobacter sp. es-MAR-4]|uniref:hypothetical protein n=1 Tax=Polynucleobacter sp. es-MAR-4 TaxID=1855655 RepID=UPI001C0E3D0B|nr:hypothetical protein [Polynucleobacter sp. es-MAR-4]MBU3637579.1 hypothetical protein [Polynucleobacter sp. es-MAR-4]